MDTGAIVADIQPMISHMDTWIKDWRWPVLALAAALGMLGAAHGFERFAYMLPCPLCLRQREIYWAVAAMALTALILWRLRPNPRFLLAINIMLGLVFLTGAVIAFYHAGVEWKFWPAPSGCSALGTIDVTTLDLTNLNQRQAVPSCTEDPFGGRFGLSMAGWNGVASLVLAALSFRAAHNMADDSRLALNPAE